MNPSVTITDHGREGEVIYREGSRAITGYQEFGGASVVAIVSMGSVDEWRTHHAWAVDRRTQILRYIADEVIRQKAPGCSVEIDDVSGNIIVRSAKTSAAGVVSAFISSSGETRASTRDGEFWMFRYRRVRGKFALIVLAIASILGAVMWIKTRVLVVESANGVPVGSTLRTETHLATLISQLQPYTPSLRHDSSTERFTLSVFLVPLDRSAPKLVRLARDLPAGSYSLARVIGSDGKTMWVDANGLYGVDLRTYSAVTADAVIEGNPELDRSWVNDTRGMDIVDGRLQMLARDRSEAYALDPDTLRATIVTPRVVNRQYSNPPLTRYMAAGLLASPSAWLGLHSKSDLDGAYRAGRWLRAVESASDSPREMRRLMRGEMEGDSSDGAHWQIRSMTPISEVEYRNASFLRVSEQSEPLRLSNPDSALMLYTSGDGVGTQSTLVVARVEVSSGRLLWSHDTGLDRFKLEQILPGEQSTVFVGTRPPVPDKVSEPLILILDHASGRVMTHSLWQ